MKTEEGATASSAPAAEPDAFASSASLDDRTPVSSTTAATTNGPAPNTNQVGAAVAPDPVAHSAKWARPIREEGLGGKWMVGRRVQVMSDEFQTWREGRVEALAALDERVHMVLFVGTSKAEALNLSQVRWKLDRSEDVEVKSGNAKKGKTQCKSPASVGSPVKRRGRPKKNPDQSAVMQASTVATVAPVVPSARAVDPNACKEPLRRKLETLYDALEDTPVYTALGGARAKAGRRQGTLEYDEIKETLNIRCGDKVQTLQEFVEAVVGPKERPKEHVFLVKNDEPLVEYETTLSGYGRMKLVDGTRVRLMFDDDDWYSGKVIGYNRDTARYRLVFDDGEEAECRHALFEPQDGFFLDNGKDCGMQFRTRASTSCKAALAAEEDAEKDLWRAPGPGEEGGGKWLEGKRIRVFWSFDAKFHEAVVEEYDPDPNAVDSRDFVGPVHRVRYDESKKVGVFPENLSKCVWNLPKNENRPYLPSSLSSEGKKMDSPVQGKAEPALHLGVASTAAFNGLKERLSKPKAQVASSSGTSPVKSGLSALIDEGECIWTAPHWKFKTGGDWLVGRKIKLYWDAERQWFTGRVLSYDGTPHAQDSHGNIGPVHEVSYDDGVFFENLTGARWKLDANEGPSGSSLSNEGSTGVRALSGDGGAKRGTVEESEKAEPQAAKRAKSSKESVFSKTSLDPRKTVLKLPDGGESKRDREADIETQTSKKLKKTPKDDGDDKTGAKESAGIAAPTSINCNEDFDLSRLDLAGRRWKFPDDSCSRGGEWLIGRCVRLYWDDDAEWFPGIVVHFDERADAVDSHGNTGPIHSIMYKDGRFDENLDTAKWQYDSKEGPPAVSVKGQDPGSGIGAKQPAADNEKGSSPAVSGYCSSGGEEEGGGKSGQGPMELDADERRGASGWRSECGKMLGRLMRNDKAIPFLEPVDPVAMNIPDYLDIIKTPMDLGTVRSKLERDGYSEPAQVLRDIVQCFNNAIEYNPAKEPAHKCALAMHTTFASLCNGSSVLRSVLSCLDSSGPSVSKCPIKNPALLPSPAKKKANSIALSPSNRTVSSTSAKKDAGTKFADAEKSDGKAADVMQEETSEVRGAKRGGPRLHAQSSLQSPIASASESGKQSFKLQIHTKGRQWTSPTGTWCQGGQWLLGRHIQVYWDDDKTWFPGVVCHFDARPTAKDSHGNTGPVHDVFYEDGSFLENLSTAKWQFDLKEGPAGQSVDLEAPAAEKKPSAGMQKASGLATPTSACEACRQARKKCVHMQMAAEAAGLCPPAKKEKPKSVDNGSPGQQTGRATASIQSARLQASAQPARTVTSVSSATAAAAAAAAIRLEEQRAQAAVKQAAVKQAATAKVPVPLVAQKPQQLRGVKQDLWRKELEYEVVYGPGKTQWTTGLNKDANFRELLLAFIQQAFPDRSVLHPWMQDFKKHMWSWGYREKQMVLQGPEEDKEDAEGIVRVCGVQVLDGNTQYRTTSEGAGDKARHKWVTVTPSTSLKLHRMAANFLFGAIGVLSLHMGRDKHSKFLRHLNVYAEFEKGWDAFEQGLHKSQGDGSLQQNGHFPYPSAPAAGNVPMEVAQMNEDGRVEGL